MGITYNLNAILVENYMDTIIKYVNENIDYQAVFSLTYFTVKSRFIMIYNIGEYKERNIKQPALKYPFYDPDQKISEKLRRLYYV